jgi:hypothetical protein
MAQGSTQPVTDMNTRNLPGGIERSGHKADNFTAFFESVVWKMWEPLRLNKTKGLHSPLQG